MVTTQEQIYDARVLFGKMVKHPELCWLCVEQEAEEPTLGLCLGCRADLRGNE